MTGDPKRQVSFGTYNVNDKPPTVLAFDQLTFPACEKCNSDFSSLEDRAKTVIERLLERESLTCIDFNCLLDWLDKVRTGMWLGLLWLDGNPWGIAPKFHIGSRLGLHDRSVGIGFVDGREPGVNLVGPESPCFGLVPTTMCIFINHLALFSSSTLGLCSRRLGFPFPAQISMRSNGFLEAWLAPGLERIIKPVERAGLLQSHSFVYQPVFERDMDGAFLKEYDTTYVRANSFDFNAGLGALYLQFRGEVVKLTEGPTDSWVSGTALSLVDTYRAGRRWAYRKLERHYLEQAEKANRLPFHVMHSRIVKIFEREMGL